jgi:hypothetical protein
MSGPKQTSQFTAAASAVPRSPEREFVFRSENPYAQLSVFEEPEEDVNAQAHRYVALLQNPYASLSVFDQEGDEMTVAPSQVELPIGSTSSVNTRARPGISKSAFAKGCREILRQYEPLNLGTTRLRPQFLDFIKQNQKKGAESRAAILEQLSRYNLGECLHPHLNREREAEVMGKILSISDSYPS